VPKTTTTFDFAMTEPPHGKPLVEWLYEEVRSAILDGRLKRGMRLPSSRELARLYGVSRGTVTSAFGQLHSEGYVQGKVGAGTSVSERLPEDLLLARQDSDIKSRERKAPTYLSQYARRLSSAPPARLQPARAFRIAEPALDSFPLSLWAQVTGRRLRRATRNLLASADAKGYLPLREAIASYLGSARGVRCTADQVIIVAGIQQALDLTARLVLDPGDAVWLEDPCFPFVASMLKALGAKIIPVPVDRQGLNVTEGRRRYDRAKLAYVTPAHQFPLGVTMSLDRRLALSDWARRAGGLIFEDDYDSEYRYSGRPISALQGLDQSGSVIFSGSFSKILFPSLRLGYVVVPDFLVDKFAAARFATDRHSSVIDQAVLCDFLTEGHLGRHIRRMRGLYADRLAALRDAVRAKIGGILELPEIEAGVQMVGWLGEGLSARAVAKTAGDLGVEVMPVDQFALRTRTPEGLVLGFGAVDDREICRGVNTLASAIETCAKRKVLAVPRRATSLDSLYPRPSR
jgi:GntR family transcriptional regulator / MocR family aminotransferase